MTEEHRPPLNQDPEGLGQASPADAPETMSLSAWRESAVVPINAQTQAVYIQRTWSIANAAMRRWSGDQSFQLPKDELAHVAIGQIVEELFASDLSPGTKNTYRAALLWACRSEDVIAPGPERDRALHALLSFRKSIQRDTRVVRSREPGRSIPEEDVAHILDGLMSARVSVNGFPQKTASWVLAGLASGARPGEWENAHWVDRARGILRLPNIKLKKHAPHNWKHVPLRLIQEAEDSLREMAGAEVDAEAIELLELESAHGVWEPPERYFAEAMRDAANNPEAFADLKRLRAWELLRKQMAWRDVVIEESRRVDVDTHLAYVTAHVASGESFNLYFNNCRAALRRACLLVFPDGRLYSLYDTRSTASANMQVSLTPREAANAMGHYSSETRTIRRHYAGPDRSHARGARYAPRAANTETQSNFESLQREAIQASTDRVGHMAGPAPLDDGGGQTHTDLGGAAGPDGPMQTL